MKLRELTTLARRLENVDIAAITADSRNIVPGSLFAALPGSQVDGRAYIQHAIEKGAAAILAPPGTLASIPVIESEEPRLTLAQIAMRFHPGQPDTVVGITGTNGKTSVARFTQQLWANLGRLSGTLGTLGAFAPSYEYALRHTTPDPVEIHQILSTMATMGTTHLAMEISSHGLSQFRADGVAIKYAAFTNITQDHLDYHADFESYFDAKLRLLTGLLPEQGTAIINADGPGAGRAIAATRCAGRHVMTVGRAGDDVTLLDLQPTTTGLAVRIRCDGKSHDVELDLIGAFQADNALVAAGIAIASGHEPDLVIERLSRLTPAPGRMEKIGVRRFEREEDATVYVDFAHTPDAIATALAAIRPHASGKVHIVFGAGGDRDRAKRPLMAKVATAGASRVIVTDDNPRSEDLDTIRADICAGASGVISIAGREVAIEEAINALSPGDVLLVAGKGHEQGQTIQGVTYPFDDAEVCRRLLKKVNR